MSQHILVIEDNSADAALIRAYLEDSNFSHKLFHTESLQEGLQIIQEKEINLVLLDLSLRDSIGFGTLREFLREATETPVIVMTGNNSEIVGIQAVRAGAQDFLVKGEFDQRSLLRSIRYSLQRFRSQSKLRQEAKELTMKEKRNQEFHKMARIGQWEMDLVSSSMKWNNEMYRIFGFQSVSFAPSLSDYLNFVHLEDRERIEDFFREASIRDGEVHHTQHRVVVNKAKPRLLSVQAKAKLDEFSDRIVLFGSVQDVTERAQEVDTDFSQPMPPSHERTGIEMGFSLQKPLFGTLSLLHQLEKGNGNGGQRDLIESLKLSFDELLGNVNDLLQLQLLMRPGNIPETEGTLLTRDLVNRIRSLIQVKSPPRQAKTKLKVSPELPDKIQADRHLLPQVLITALDCMLRYSPAASRNTLHFDWVEEDGQHWIVAHFRNPDCLIKADELERIQGKEQVLDLLDWNRPENHPLFTLACVDRLTRILRGRFEWQKKNDRVIDLILHIPVALPETEPSSPLNGAPERTIQVLLVEDNSMQRITMRRALTGRSEKISVEEAENGLKGVQRFQEKAFDLVLMDLQMPVMDGLKAAIRIRSMSDIPIFAFTTEASPQEEADCRAAGINEYLVKPAPGEELFRRILKYIS